MTEALEELVSTLLWEGYALFPYTPGATKNATPTPFGIVYPPAHAAGSPTTFDHVRMVAMAQAGPGATLRATARFLEPAGVRHEGVERRVELPATPVDALVGEPVTEHFSFDAVHGRVRMAAQAFDGGMVRVTMCVHNTTEVPEGLDRATALRSSLLSTHPLLQIEGGRFLSLITPPQEAAGAVMTCRQVNTFPVLAAPADDVLLGCAIMLYDHPRIAPESRGSLFDGTEIEEALRLHLLALSDGERSELEHHDPALREMLEKAIATAPQDLLGLHGRVEVREPAGAEADSEIRGEQELTVDGVTYRRGEHVRLRPPAGHNAHDHLLEDRTATIERIYIDYDDKVHLCVTVDDDPGQQIMRDIGRYLYFKPDEVEHV